MPGLILKREEWALQLVCFGVLLLQFFVTGCVTRMGPRTIPSARFNYNETIARSLNEQLLLNLVRLRYRDTLLFIDVGTVVAQYSLSGRASASPIVNVEGKDQTEYGFGVSGSYSERPTITYEPLKGEEFAQRLLAPISPVTLILLSESGWSIERLLLCCVQQINDLKNAPSATGPTPSYFPENKDFRELAGLLRKLQMADVLNFRATYEEEQPAMFFHLARPLPEDPWKTEIEAVRKLLGLSDQHELFRITSETLRRESDEIAVSGRSLLGVLFFLSQAVEAPQAHQEQGLVTVAEGPEGKSLDWAKVTGNLLRIHSQAGRPSNTFVRINYRGHWFQIEDRDLHSKATFNLLTYLFSLQAARVKGVSPLLTVPVGVGN